MKKYKIKNIRFLLIISLLFLSSSCYFIGKAWSPCGPPDVTSYKYYNPKFVLDSLSVLNTDKTYLQTVYIPRASINSYYILKFFKNGIVKYKILHEGEKLSKDFLKPNHNGRTGYYVLDEDSLKFTTNICYNHEFEKRFEGIIRRDTIFLNGYSEGSGYAKTGNVSKYILVATSINDLPFATGR